MRTTTLKIIIIILISSLSTSCSGFFKYSDARKNPTAGEARAKKNVKCIYQAGMLISEPCSPLVPTGSPPIRRSALV